MCGTSLFIVYYLYGAIISLIVTIYTAVKKEERRNL